MKFPINISMSILLITLIHISTPSAQEMKIFNENKLDRDILNFNEESNKKFDNISISYEINNLQIKKYLDIQSNLKPDKGLSRDLKDAQIFKAAAPGVVLIATNDGIGSGSLINDSGYIITNYHVIKGAKDIGVFYKPLKDGDEPKKQDIVFARVLRVNEIKDLALIQANIVPKNQPKILLGDENSIAIGLDVHAIGHPHGDSWTYTKGVISQIRNNYTWSAGDQISHQANIIQTQTPINPGNSGGPLLDSSGMMIGINSFKDTKGENLNFSVSISDVKEFLNSSSNVFAQSSDAVSGKNSTNSCKNGKITYNGPNQKNNANLTVLESKCDGKADIAIIMPFDTNEPEMMWFGLPTYQQTTIMFFSPGRNDSWEYSFVRDNYKSRWQAVCFYENSDIKNPKSCKNYDEVMANN